MSVFVTQHEFMVSRHILQYQINDWDVSVSPKQNGNIYIAVYRHTQDEDLAEDKEDDSEPVFFAQWNPEMDISCLSTHEQKELITRLLKDGMIITPEDQHAEWRRLNDGAN